MHDIHVSDKNDNKNVFIAPMCVVYVK